MLDGFAFVGLSQTLTQSNCHQLTNYVRLGAPLVNLQHSS
jgi:hypothetical protein